MTAMIPSFLVSCLLFSSMVDFTVSKRLDLTIESSGDFDFSGDVTDQNPHLRVSDYVSDSSQSTEIDFPPDFSGDIIVVIEDETPVDDQSGSGSGEEESGSGFTSIAEGSASGASETSGEEEMSGFGESSIAHGSGGGVSIPIFNLGREIPPYRRTRFSRSVLHRAVESNTSSSNGNASSSNSTCAAQLICFADSDCGDTGRCLGVFPGTCNCAACVNLAPCLNDSFCGALQGACDNSTQRCNCLNGQWMASECRTRFSGYTAAGFASLTSALSTLCNNKNCDASMSQCFGLPCNMGRCFC